MDGPPGVGWQGSSEGSSTQTEEQASSGVPAWQPLPRTAQSLAEIFDRSRRARNEVAAQSIEVPTLGRVGPSASMRASRLLDIALAGAALIVLAPLIGLLALAIKLESPGPIFYRCRRVGLGRREFQMLKFRKMQAAAAGPALTATDDERFTRIGRLLARTKLDEIPQLWNVVVGDMSLVGPRPEDPWFVAHRPTDYDEILQVKPGITGLTQLAFARESEILDPSDPVGDYVRRLLPRKAEIDRLYVARRSVVMDLRILAWTARTLLVRSNVAVHQSTGRITLRRRPSPAEASLQADVVGGS
jgi:lipopolysaccharide/colanic/teichoic acid biosynthesis glycosyltransferase